MRYFFNILICICLSGFLLCLNAQDQYDLQKVEADLVKKINTYREKIGIATLWNDSLLYISATEHADYLKKNNEHSIFEDSRRNASPQKRAEGHGAENYFVAEIISVLKLDNEIGTDSIADLLFKNHIKCPVNKAYIHSRMFKVHAVKLLHYNDHELLFVHEMADPGKEYTYRLCPKIFPHDNSEIPSKSKSPKFVKKYEWKIKAPKKEDHCDGMLDVYKRLRNVEVVQDGKSVKLILDKESIAKQLIDGKKDGIAIEAISSEQYLCDNSTYYSPKKRNHYSLLNGELMKPKFMEDIFAESGYRDDNKDYFSTGLGYIKSEDEFVEANVVLIENKKVCKIIGPKKICGEALNYHLEELPYIDNFYSAEYHPDVEYDTLKMTIYYKPNQTEPDMEAVEKIIEFVQKEGLVISRAYVNANASIEGSKEINERIFNQRANYLIDLFEEKQAYSIKRKIKMQENWSLFYSQIKNTKFSYLELEDTAVARHVVNDSVDFFAEYLDKQRFAQVNLFAVTKATRDQFKVFAMSDFNQKILDIAASYESGKSTSYERLIEEAGKIQLFLYDLYRNGEISDEFLKMMKIPEDPEYADLRFIKLMFDYRYVNESKRISESDFFSQLEKMIKQENAGALQYYNFLAYLIRHYGDEAVMDYHTSKKIKSYMAKAKSDLVFEHEYNKIDFHYNYLKAEELFEKNELRKASTCLNAIREYYEKHNADTSAIVNLAKYYIQFNETEDAYKLVEAYFNKKTKNVELIGLYLKLHYLDFWKEDRPSDYYYLLEEMYSIMETEDWKKLFVGKCNLSVQLFDYEPLRQLYYCMQQ